MHSSRAPAPLPSVHMLMLTQILLTGISWLRGAKFLCRAYSLWHNKNEGARCQLWSVLFHFPERNKVCIWRCHHCLSSNTSKRLSKKLSLSSWRCKTNLRKLLFCQVILNRHRCLRLKMRSAAATCAISPLAQRQKRNNGGTAKCFLHCKSYQAFLADHISLFISFLAREIWLCYNVVTVCKCTVSVMGQCVWKCMYFFNLFCLPVALIKYIRPVFVSRSDQNSRKKTVEEIKRRAHSGGEWPQVKPWNSASSRTEMVKKSSVFRWNSSEQDVLNKTNGTDQKSTGQIQRGFCRKSIVVISRKCWLIHTCDIHFPKVIVWPACTLGWLQSSVPQREMSDQSRFFFFFFSCWACSAMVLHFSYLSCFQTFDFLFSLCCTDHDISRGDVHQQILPNHL